MQIANSSSTEMFALCSQTCLQKADRIFSMATSGEKLKALREEAGLSVRVMAKLLDMNYGTYNSRESRSKKPYLEWELAQKVIPIFEEYGIEKERVIELVGEKGELEQVATVPKDVKPQIRVDGYVQAGVWNGDSEITGDDVEFLTVPLPDELVNVRGIQALEVRGDSMNLVFPEGSILFVMSPLEIDKRGLPIENGDYVVVRRRNDDGLWETTVKELELRPDNEWRLIARTTNARFAKPMVYRPEDDTEEHLDDGSADKLHISGVVVHSIVRHKTLLN